MNEESVERVRKEHEEATDGLLAVLAGAALEDRVLEMHIPTLSVLPVGRIEPAPVPSPANIHRLFEMARQHYDRIIIDTGPVTSRTEAWLVAAQADGVIFMITRGVQRDLVSLGLSRLASIGAKMSGVVFNRARSQDLERAWV